MVRTVVGLTSGVASSQRLRHQRLPAPGAHAPAGLIFMEQVPPEQQRVHTQTVRVLQDLLKRDKRVMLAYLVVLPHAQVVIRRDQQPELPRVLHEEGEAVG